MVDSIPTHIPVSLIVNVIALETAARRSLRSRWSLVLRAAEAEDREENKRQQKQTNPKAHSFPETLSQVDEKNDRDYEINERN